MKTNTIIMTALLAATAAAPAFAAGPMLDKAVQTAANKAASIEKVEQAIAAATEEDRAAAPAVLTDVLAKRTSWTNANVYRLYNAVLLSSGLKSSLSQDLKSYAAGENQQDPGVKLLTALNKACATLPGNTFQAVMTMLLTDANGTAAVAEALAKSTNATNTNAGICTTPPRDQRPNPVPVTPDPISPQN